VWLWRRKWNILWNRVWMQQQTKCACTGATGVLLHCADSGEVPHMKHFKWHMWPQSRTTNRYKLRTISHTMKVQQVNAVQLFTVSVCWHNSTATEGIANTGNRQTAGNNKLHIKRNSRNNIITGKGKFVKRSFSLVDT